MVIVGVTETAMRKRINRLPNRLVEHGARKRCAGASHGSNGRDLMQSKQPQMADQERAGPREHPAKDRERP